MATQEQMQKFFNTSSDGSSDEKDDVDDESSTEELVPVVKAPKLRIGKIKKSSSSSKKNGSSDDDNDLEDVDDESSTEELVPVPKMKTPKLKLKLRLGSGKKMKISSSSSKKRMKERGNDNNKTVSTSSVDTSLSSLIKKKKKLTTKMMMKKQQNKQTQRMLPSASQRMLPSATQRMLPSSKKKKLKKRKHQTKSPPIPLIKAELVDNEEEDEDDDDSSSSASEAELVTTKSKSEETAPTTPMSSATAEVEVIVDATVVDDDDDEDVEEEEVTIVVPVVSSSSVSTIKTTSSSHHSRNPSAFPKTKRQSVRPIKMPAIASPGLLLANGNTTAAQFDHHMKVAGYSLETRIENPHRGSSTKREVGDMFDSDVILTTNFPKLVPPELIEDESKTLLPMLNKGLKAPDNERINNNNRKRCRFDDMIPISLKIDYPEDYIDQRLEYVKKVKIREDAIREAQEAELEDMPSVTIPPIPNLPPPPQLEDNQLGLDIQGSDNNDDKMTHPLYPPRNGEFVKHLDPNCFHSSRGRYLGLSSNSLSDPHFTGAHAVGVQNLSVTAGTGLATTQTGSTSAGSASLASTVYGDRGASSGGKSSGGGGGGDSSSAKNGSAKKDITKKSSVKKKRSTASSAPTSSGTAADLKKIMERKTKETEEMRRCIIKAGVYASRTGRHGQSFVGPDGNTYPDVSKTFASYAGIKPCNRCKNNKQGAYHCRLRRRHKEQDHDGGDSPAILAPLFDDLLESLTNKKSMSTSVEE